MKAKINNKSLVIEDPSEEILSIAKNNLIYKDKAKEYQIRRMMRNPWTRTSPQLKELRDTVEGVLYKLIDSTIVIPSSLFYLFESDIGSNLIDDRKETGKTVVLPWVKEPYPLRPYQQEAVDLMLSLNRGVINFATGLGKTLIALHTVKKYKKTTLIVCPSESVAKQFYSLFVKSFGQNKVAFFGAGKKKTSDITIGIAASISKSISIFKNLDIGLMIIDETHHTPANTFYDIAEGLADVGKVFGLTATDYRSDGKDILINAGCGPVLIRRDIKWGVDNKWLAEPFFFMRQVKTSGRDYKDDKLKSYKEHVLNNQKMKDVIKKDAEKMMSLNKSVLILVDEVAHGEELARQPGIPFATGTDSKSQDYVDALNNGEIPGLVGTDGKIGEGSDTQNVDVLILANFVASRGPVIQAVGRGLRRTETKTKCIIIDYCPTGSTMLSRHAINRMGYYKQITDRVSFVKDSDD